MRNGILTLLLLVFSVSLHGKDENKALTAYLDHIIDTKEEYTRLKEERIKNLRELLGKPQASAEYVYEINRKLFGEFKKFKLDSAIHYARRNVQIAEELNNRPLKDLAEIDLAGAYSFSAKFLESKELLQNINSGRLSRDLKASYYETWSLFYQHYVALSGQGNYWHEANVYRDSLLSVVDPSSLSYRMHVANRLFAEGKQAECEEQMLEMLAGCVPDSPEYASMAHSLGTIYGRLNRLDLQRKYHMLAAVADIKSAIKENASFHRLASLSYEDGNIAQAFKYAQSAIEDALFSGVQFRTAEISYLYSIINSAYQVKEARTNSKLRSYLTLISILSVFLILLVLSVYRQMRKISRIKEILSQTNDKLLQLNNELNGANEQLNRQNESLSESNNIREQYIAQFFDLCSSYVDKMEEYRKGLYKLAINRQYEELVKRLKSTAFMDREIEELYIHFDSIFLSLYPTFVTDFNMLLAEDEQISLRPGSLLNRELRIYALLRLGITDSTKVAGFLRCSMSTIYNYRTKMRNKAAINRDEFEEMVMRIGGENAKTE